MRKHGNKKIPPAAAALCLTGYYLGGAILLTRFKLPGIVTISVLAGALILSAVIIAVLVERIQEIKSGETDDLGKY